MGKLHPTRRAQTRHRRLMKRLSAATAAVGVLTVALFTTLMGTAPAMAAGGPDVQWHYDNGAYTIALPATDAWEVKQISPSQHIFCGENYGNPCTTERFSQPLAAGECVTVQVDWAGRHGYNSDDYKFCAPKDPDNPPSNPDAKVTYTDWVDQKWTCGDTSVTQTRTKTTTPYKVELKDGKWITVEDTANAKTEMESQTRPLTDAESKSCQPEQPKKVFVCKYVGTPSVDERLQTGNNPISVSVDAIQHNSWDGTVPGWFSDAHDRSYVLAYDTGQAKPDVSSCPQSEQPPVATCVEKPTLSYTFDGVGSGAVMVTAKNAEKGDKLCDALDVRATTYEYDRPASGNPSWPQTLVGYNDVTVDSIGTFSYAAPALDVCRQHDIYAEFASKGGFDSLKVPQKLNGPNNPYEPKFLHQTLSGKGPNPTYSTTSSTGCNTPPTTPEPKIEYSSWQDQQWVCGDTDVTQTRTKTTTPYKVELVEGSTWKVVEDTDNVTVTTETQTRALTNQEIASCKPDIPEPKVTYTDWNDEAWVCGDESVTQTRTKTTTPWVPVLVSGSTWELQPDTAHAVVETESQTRPLTDEEIASCKPDVPQPKVEYTDWQDQQWVCGDTSVTQTRTKTTTPYKVELKDGKWITVEDTANVKTETESQTRPLTDEEIGTCPLLMGGVNPVCVGSVPYLQWSNLTLPEGFTPKEGATLSVTFINPVDSSQNYTVNGLPIADGKILWPGATDGAVKNWPGWVRNANGTYSETDRNYRWTREGVDILFKVNPEYTATVHYPESSSVCANPPKTATPPSENPPSDTPSTPPASPKHSSTPPTLAETGSNGAQMEALGGIALAALALGGLALAVGRRMRHRHQE